ncbi:hypothetical protein D9C73_012095 [Collichthys lucidus]|uniref:Putative WW-binding domain-containing protein n=1 Tax=Collichthys lucidus TaxID=240159 RepID=A0A4U5UV13_COLLU|nr:hypothetical protein D9C73_012163 [Collichthys lucidus]TKS79077.1 hypothetical protein D9C73_012095 [Collichthys lucidus]
MAKRRAEDSCSSSVLLHGSPSKRCCSSLCGGVDMQLGSVVPTGAVSPESLLALLDSRSRKRPHYSEEQPGEGAAAAAAAGLYLKATHAANVETFPGSFQDRPGSKKRPREDSTVSETVAAEEDDQADEDANTEDCAYNSFQYWRLPLPELDLSLLEDADDHSQTKDKSKVSSSSDAMET